MSVFGHFLEDHVSKDDVVFLLSGQFFGNLLQLQDLVAEDQVLEYHLLELFLDEPILLLCFFVLVL